MVSRIRRILQSILISNTAICFCYFNTEGCLSWTHSPLRPFSYTNFFFFKIVKNCRKFSESEKRYLKKIDIPLQIDFMNFQKKSNFFWECFISWNFFKLIVVIFIHRGRYISWPYSWKYSIIGIFFWYPDKIPP